MTLAGPDPILPARVRAEVAAVTDRITRRCAPTRIEGLARDAAGLRPAA